MREHGFMPFSAAGALIVVIVLGLVAHAAFSRHQRSLSAIDDFSSSFLLTTTFEVHGDLQSAVRHAVYRALWEICKEASRYDAYARKDAIELLATKYFNEDVADLRTGYSQHDARIEMYIPDETEWPSIKISDAGRGYVSARASLPSGSRIRLTSWDNRTSIAVPFENVDVYVDSRYFLLEQSMGKFVEKRGDIINSWRIMEYSKALSGSLMTERVQLVRSQSEALFDAAWAAHEFNTFGSSDYWEMAHELTEISLGGDIISDLNDMFEKSSLGITICRENIYELLPPVPNKPLPGISVFHEFNVKGLSYKREDPAGLLGLPTATPVPLGTTGVTLWWGQWEIIIELEDAPVEEIFDFDNPTLPLMHWGFYAHKSLAYRWEMPEKEYKTRVALVSFKPFTISMG